MPRIIAALIRHGDYHQLPDTPSAFQPFPLTEKGVRQSSDLAKVIIEYSQQFDCEINNIIASSRLLRAWQTAKTMADTLDDRQLMIQEYPQLAERCVGSVANLSAKQISEIITKDPRFPALPDNWKADSQFCLPFQGAESLLDAGARLAALIKSEMLQLQTDTPSTSQLKLFVGHGAAFRHAAYHLGLLKYDQIAQLSMFHCHPVLIELQADGAWFHLAGQWKNRRSQTD